MANLEQYINTPYERVSSRVRRSVQTALEEQLAPLTTRRITHFNFSSVLFIEGPFHPQHSIEHRTFRKIVEKQGSGGGGGGGAGLEALWNQLLSVMFVAGERCRESVSPRAQLSLANGLILLARMLYLYETLLHEGGGGEDGRSGGGDDPDADDDADGGGGGGGGIRVFPPAFAVDFYRQMTRLLLKYTGDEKVYHPRVVFWSNRLTSYLFKSKVYGPLFLGYLFSNGKANEDDMEWVFDACYRRLLGYEVTPHLEVRQSLTYAYSIMWSLLSYSDHDNPIQCMLAARSGAKRLHNLRTLLMSHVARGGRQPRESSQTNTVPRTSEDAYRADILSLQALQMIVNVCTYNSEFRNLFVDSDTFDEDWSILFVQSSQTIGDIAANAIDSDELELYTAKTQISQTHLVVKLIYLLSHNIRFRGKVFQQYIESQDVGSWTSVITSLFQRKLEHEEMVANGQLLTLCTWLVKTLHSNISFKYANFTVLTFVNEDISHCLIRILGIIAASEHFSHLQHDIDHVSDFWRRLLDTLMLTWRAIVDDTIPFVLANATGLRMLNLLRQYSCIIVHLLAKFMQDKVFLAQEDKAEILYKTILDHENLFDTILTTLGDARKVIAEDKTLQPEIERYEEIDEELLENLRNLMKLNAEENLATTNRNTQ